MTRPRQKLPVAGAALGTVLALAVAAAAQAQSSSLFLDGEALAAEKAAATQPAANGPLTEAAGAARPPDNVTNETLNAASFIALAPPPPRTFKSHDSVTIIVVERTRYRSDNRFQQDRRSDFSAKLNEWFRIHNHKWMQQEFPTGVPEVDFELNDRRTGNGLANRQDELTTRITAEVIDVKPNGQLVLEARRKISYGENQQVVTLVAWCSGRDVTADNSILSSQLMNLELYTDPSGQVDDASRRGWLTKIWDFARPF